MFGGHGVFHDGKMFALVNSEGGIFLKADDTNRKKFEEQGSPRHSRMPYFQVPEAVFNKQEELIDWVQQSIQTSK